MKTFKKILIIAMPILLASCMNQKYLSKIHELPQNPFGSFINIQNQDLSNVKGELLAVENGHVYVLVRSNGKSNVRATEITGITRFRLKYANSPNYWWTVPLYSAATISHGWFLFLTFPINLISTLSVSIGSDWSYVYNENTLEIDELKKYSRFPQGLPENLDLKKIKS